MLTWIAIIGLPVGMLGALLTAIGLKTGATVASQEAAQRDRDIKHQEQLGHWSSLESNLVDIKITLSPHNEPNPATLAHVKLNEFEQILFVVQKFLLGANATVETDVMMPTRGEPKSKRLVKIMVKEVVGTTPLTIAFEAVALDRYVDSGDLDVLAGKYYGPGGIAVDKVVVV